jgi:hypothetical protein
MSVVCWSLMKIMKWIWNIDRMWLVSLHPKYSQNSRSIDSLSLIDAAWLVLWLNSVLRSEKTDWDSLSCDITHIHSIFISTATGTSTKVFMSLSSPRSNYWYYNHDVSKFSPRYYPEEKIIYQENCVGQLRPQSSSKALEGEAERNNKKKKETYSTFIMIPGPD